MSDEQESGHRLHWPLLYGQRDLFADSGTAGEWNQFDPGIRRHTRSDICTTLEQ